MICTLVYNQRLSRWVFLAAFLSILGIWLLSGGVDGFALGDGLVFLCAIGFGLQVTLIGRIVQRTKSPLSLSFLQYAAATVVAGIGALLFEHVTLEGLRGALIPILYAGVLSGGIAYTLQNIAQQYTPSSDAAIILSGESVFAALSGAWLLGERLTPMQYAGCALIAIAIVVTEVMPLVLKKKRA
jgi:drug/metabolite transporter (DMT)-like permease